MTKRFDNKAALAKRYGVRITDATHKHQLVTLRTELVDDRDKGAIHGMDYENLMDYIDHREVVLNHKPITEAQNATL